MKHFAAPVTLVLSLLLAGAGSAALASNVTPTATTSAPTASDPLAVVTVPTPADINAAALRVAQAFDGVLRNCPAAYGTIGTPDKRCVGVQGDVETVRSSLSSALGSDLYGVWRSRDDQRTVFNWVKMPGGTVYLRVASDESNKDRSLIYLDAPTVPASAVTTPTPAAKPATTITKPAPAATPASTPVTSPATATPAPKTGTFQAASPNAAGTTAKKTPPQTASKSPVPVPFSRSLQLKTPRLSGSDVLAAQNRLIALTLGGKGGVGDGWYGPNTSKAVSDFQTANALKASGVLDKATWDALFSPDAKKFKAAGK
ncbi:peptidoglycan-binding protein [Deinococcus detaillensis]|uniref:Peptidoglycan-binding protein n=1 Tax=Deinococcus detaillensis TaxID=2592048 RepID=A0A553V438_9DEIO|nr:peptidoglycan-binding domain-containing protein [Deinococcus detaillensis]TSA87253.1 peptidoglycan-binding protein [Deinococcus detaillensis]